jgi:hypothetical protein
MRNALVTAIRVMARILAGIMILIYGFALLSILGGGHNHNTLPFVLEGAPFGTYEQSTQLGILTLVAGWGLSLVGAILLFWWERTAAGILIAASLVQTFLWAIWLLNHAMPTDSLRGQLVGFVLPPSVTAILLLIRLRNPLREEGRDKIPSFVDARPKQGIIYTESELESMKANEAGHGKPE